MIWTLNKLGTFEENLERIIVAAPPDNDAWLAIADRLQRSSV